MVFYLGILLLLAFVVDASITLWRRGDRHRAGRLGGTITFAYLAGGVHSALVDVGVVRTPCAVTFVYLLILVAMAWELSKDLLRSAQLSRDLRESKQCLALATRTANLDIWEWDIARDEIWVTETTRRRNLVHVNLTTEELKKLESSNEQERAVSCQSEGATTVARRTRHHSFQAINCLIASESFNYRAQVSRPAWSGPGNWMPPQDYWAGRSVILVM